MQGYNAQAAVDSTVQAIVAAESSQQSYDRRQRGDWKLVCATSNLRKLFRSGWRPDAV
jgi:hypothetical protein